MERKALVDDLIYRLDRKTKKKEKGKEMREQGEKKKKWGRRKVVCYLGRCCFCQCDAAGCCSNGDWMLLAAAPSRYDYHLLLLLPLFSFSSSPPGSFFPFKFSSMQQPIHICISAYQLLWVNSSQYR
eukprot:TRINITY_DN17787_c0_g1_i2.p1 TRINITY_DN17787_c0_g1~~TRINITY_DN17787_c0_g1_i2.p1  ORF type:complete len:127 (+),score=27.97 TRINITY_DN17787_c0_g1_i2:394-774(+)